MEDALQRCTNDFLERLRERQFPDIYFSFPDSASAKKSLDGDIVAAHRHVIIAASPYMRNKIGTSFTLDYADPAHIFVTNEMASLNRYDDRLRLGIGNRREFSRESLADP
jgi:hypothetical protein